MPASTVVTSENTSTRLLLALAQDTFHGRNVAHSWGTASDGVDVWTFPVGTTSASVSGGTGQLTGAASNTIGFLGSQTIADGEMRVRVSSSTSSSSLMAVLRATSANTYYRGGIDASGQVSIQKVVGGALSDLVSLSLSWTASTNYWLHFRVQGSVLALSVWQDGGGSEPAFQITVFDTDITGAGQFGIRAKPSSTTATLSFDSLVVWASFPFPVMTTTTTRLALSANRQADLSLRLRALARTLPQVPMRLVLQLLANLLYRDTPSRLALSATRKQDTHTHLSFFTARLLSLGQRVALLARTGADTALRFFVSSPSVAEWTNLWSRVRLAQAQDSFANRTTSSGWGNASDSQNTWTINGTITSYVSQGWGQFTGNNAGVTAFLGSHTLADAQMRVLVGGSNADATMQAVLRATATGTYYRGGLDGNDVISLVRTVGGVPTTLASAPYTWDPMIAYWIRFRVEGTSLLLKVWPEGWDEPPGWMLTCTDSAIVGAGQVGVRSKTGSSTDINYFTSVVVTGANNPLSVFDDLAAFLRLRAIRAKDQTQRLALAADRSQSLSSRIRAQASRAKDATSRLLVSAGTNTWFKSVGGRLVLAVLSKMDLGTRMSVLPGRQFFLALRTSLIALSPRDLMSRVSLVVSALKTSAGRESSTRVRTAVVQDTFVRPNRSGGWGPSPPDGRAWSFVNPLALSIASNSAVMTGRGGGGDTLALLTLPATLSAAQAQASQVTLSDDESIMPTGLSTANVEVVALLSMSNPGSSTTRADASGVVVRAATTTTYYRAGFLTTGAFALSKVIAGAVTDLATLPAVNPVAGTRYWIRLRAIGPLLAARYWQDGGGSEPSTWQLAAFETDIPDGGHVGLRMKMTTSTSATISCFSFVACDSTPSFPMFPLLMRLRMSALALKGTAIRMNLVPLLSFQLKDLKSRLTVYTGHLASVVARLRMSALVRDDAMGRMALRAFSLYGLGTRLLYAYSSTLYSPLRLAVAASTQLGYAVRMALSSLIGGLDTGLRTRIGATGQTDWGARFALFAPTPPPLSTPPPADRKSTRLNSS